MKIIRVMRRRDDVRPHRPKIRGLTLTPTSFLTTQTGWVDNSPFKFQPPGSRLTKMSIEHILWQVTLAGCEMMPWTIIQLSLKPSRKNFQSKISEHRSSTICMVVERPDHHCGDDLVFSSCTNEQIYFISITVVKAIRLMPLVLIAVFAQRRSEYRRVMWVITFSKALQISPPYCLCIYSI